MVRGTVRQVRVMMVCLYSKFSQDLGLVLRAGATTTGHSCRNLAMARPAVRQAE